MELHTIKTGPMDVNTYILFDESEGECVLIDPSGAKKINAFLNGKGLKPTHILITHPHFDHIMAVDELAKEYGAKICIHRDGVETLKKPGRFAFFTAQGADADILLNDGDVIEAAGISIKVIHTPGHEPSAVCFVVEKERMIFSGDTLFHLSVGRTDFKGGNAQTLYESIAYKLFTLEGDYTVYPGHDRFTALEFERLYNPFMKRARK